MPLSIRFWRVFACIAALLSATGAQAEWGLNMPEGVTEISQRVYDIHMLIFWVCVVIGIVVFGAMIYSILAHRKSRGAEASQFHHSTAVEIVWTIVPFVILIAMAIPAAGVLMDMEDTRGAEMNIKITGYQWKWQYEYLEEGIGFYSTLAETSNKARQLNSGIDPASVENYLLEVDKPLVVPVDTKIRLLITSADVIHAWWVIDLAVKKDAIPGYINETWFEAEETGIYRGKCAELCGRDHGFMPVVVEVKTKEDYAAWVAENNGNSAKAVEPAAKPAAAQKPAQPAAAVIAPVVAEPAVVETAPVVEPANPLAAAVAAGEVIYQKNCVACHQIDGQGIPGAYPALAGSAMVTGDVPAHIKSVRDGIEGTGMLAFGSLLSAEDIAAVVTYERNAWGNDTGDLVTAAQVKAAQ